MRIFLLGLVVLCLQQTAAHAGERGVVVAVTTGCADRYVAYTSGGFVLLEWYGGYSPYWLSKEAIIEKLLEQDCTW